MTLTKSYKITFPTYNTDIPNINFSANINGINFVFTFEYFNDQWNGWCTFNGITRLLGVIPFIYNWLSYFDYIVVFDTPVDEIGQADLQNTTLWVLQWD